MVTYGRIIGCPLVLLRRGLGYKIVLAFGLALSCVLASECPLECALCGAGVVVLLPLLYAVM